MKRITVAGHSLHPMLIVFPLGLLATSLVWDLVFLASDNLMWAAVAFWSIVAGIVGGLIAAVPGLLDWLAIPAGTRAKRIGALHGLINVSVVVLFVISAALRLSDGYTTPSVLSMLIGWIGIGGAVISGWLGGELVERLGVGVHDFQDLNAPSSLRAPARESRPNPI